MSTITITNLTCPDAVAPADKNNARSSSAGTVMFFLDHSPNDFQITLAASAGETVTVKKRARIKLTFDQTGLVLPASLGGAPDGWSYEQDPLNSKNLRITRTGDKLEITPGSPAVLKIAGVTAEKNPNDSSNLQATFKDVVKQPDDVVFSVIFQNAAAGKKDLPVICNFDQERGGNIVYVGGIKNDRSFTIEYTATEDMPNATPGVRITVWFDSCPDGSKQPRALATDDKIADIRLSVEHQDGTSWSLDSASPDKNNRWHLTPANGTPVFKARGDIRIGVSDIESLQNAGRSNMYIKFASIEGYNDCTMFVPIDKVGPYRFLVHHDAVGDATDVNTIDLWSDYKPTETSPASRYGALQPTDAITIPKTLARYVEPLWEEPQPLPVVSGCLIPLGKLSTVWLRFKFGKDTLHDIGVSKDGVALTVAILGSSGLSFDVQEPDEVHLLTLSGGEDGVYQVLPLRFRQLKAGQDYTGVDLSNLDLSGVDLSAAVLEKTDFTGVMIDDTTAIGHLFTAGAKNVDAIRTPWGRSCVGMINDIQSNLDNWGRSQTDWWNFHDSSHITSLAGTALVSAGSTPGTGTGACFDDSVFPNDYPFSFAGAWLWNASFARAQLLSGSFPLDFTGSDLRSANFSSAVMPGVKFTGARLNNAVFADVQMANVDFSGSADLSGAKFSGAAKMANANFTHATLTNASFEGADLDLSNADFSNADLSGARFSGTTKMTGAKFGGAKLTNASFTGADLDLSNVDFSGVTDLSGATFSANLTGASFRNRDLTTVKFESSTLDSADLRGTTISNVTSLAHASLKGVDFSGFVFNGVDLTKASLDGACLFGAGLKEAKIDGASFKNAGYDAQTTWPNDVANTAAIPYVHTPADLSPTAGFSSTGWEELKVLNHELALHDATSVGDNFYEWTIKSPPLPKVFTGPVRCRVTVVYAGPIVSLGGELNGADIPVDVYYFAYEENACALFEITLPATTDEIRFKIFGDKLIRRVYLDVCRFAPSPDGSIALPATVAESFSQDDNQEGYVAVNLFDLDSHLPDLSICKSLKWHVFLPQPGRYEAVVWCSGEGAGVIPELKVDDPSYTGPAFHAATSDGGDTAWHTREGWFFPHSIACVDLTAGAHSIVVSGEGLKKLLLVMLRPSSSDNAIELLANDAHMESGSPTKDSPPHATNVPADKVLCNWIGGGESGDAAWSIEAPADGDYDVEVWYARKGDGPTATLSVNNAVAWSSPNIPDTGDWWRFGKLLLGTVKLTKGPNRIALRTDSPSNGPDGLLMNLWQVRLVPRGIALSAAKATRKGGGEFDVYTKLSSIPVAYKDGILGHWDSGNEASWKFEVPSDGRYECLIWYCRGRDSSCKLTLSVTNLDTHDKPNLQEDDMTLHTVYDNWSKYMSQRLGWLSLTKGHYELSITNTTGSYGLMGFWRICLLPVP